MRNYNLRKRVLVTGDAGFLGSHLCERLLGDGLRSTIAYFTVATANNEA